MKASYIFSLLLSVAFLSFLPVEAVSGTRSCTKTTKTSVREVDIEVITFMGYSLVNGVQMICTTIDGTPQIVQIDPKSFLPPTVTLSKQSVDVNGQVNYKAAATLPKGVEFETVRMFCDSDEKAGSGWVILESCQIEYVFSSPASVPEPAPSMNYTPWQLVGIVLGSLVAFVCLCNCLNTCCGLLVLEQYKRAHDSD